MHHIDGTANHGKLHDAWMPLGANYHSNVFLEYVYVASLMWVYILMVCRIVNEIQQLISPSWQALFLCIVLHLLFNQWKPQKIDTISFH